MEGDDSGGEPSKGWHSVQKAKPGSTQWDELPQLESQLDNVVHVDAQIKDVDGEQRNIHTPMKPFLIWYFDPFKAGLLSRPGMEAILDRDTLFNDTDVWDVPDGTVIKDLIVPVGVIPGPRGLSVEELEHFIAPLVEHCMERSE